MSIGIPYYFEVGPIFLYGLTVEFVWHANIYVHVTYMLSGAGTRLRWFALMEILNNFGSMRALPDS